MNTPIELQIKARHVNAATNYMDTERCPVARAAMEHFQTEVVGEGVNYLYVKHKDHPHEEYDHDAYEVSHYREDKEAAKDLPDETVIRTIVLTKRTEENEKVSGI